METQTSKEIIKELELEAEKFGYGKNGIMSDEAKAYIAGATSKYVEKQKLEFAIGELKKFSNKLIMGEGVLSNLINQEIESQIKELEQKLNTL